MCGIVGFINKDKLKKNNKNIIKDMILSINHRGPDSSGIYVDNYISLGHVRLSIVDDKKGKQPLKYKEYIIIYNGEIYNYKSLRKDLMNKGYKFKTNSDTEVLLIGYYEYKEKILNYLKGMFTFAIYNKKDNSLFIARDNFGIKPLYYYYDNDVFMFSSEIKAFNNNPNYILELNKDLLPSYLQFGYSEIKNTFFKNVYKLKPGSYLIYKNNNFKEYKYYKIKFKNEKCNYNKLEKNIISSIKYHNTNDKNCYSFLSSGVDSSLITCVLKPKNTFTIGYKENKYNELNYAKNLTNKLNINNKYKIINKDEYLESVNKIMYYMDEPLADPASISLFFCFMLSSLYTKIILSGEGADEFFAGYNTYSQIKYRNKYKIIPKFIRKLISCTFNNIKDKKYFSFLVRNGKEIEDEYIGVNRIFNEKEVKKLIKFESNFNYQKYIKELFDEESKKYSDLQKMQYIDINTFLVNDIFLKLDKMSMANSIEARVPYADINVFEEASKLNDNDKINNKTTKVKFRKIAKKYILNNSYSKKKLGFPVPLREWIKSENYYHTIKNKFNNDISKKFFHVKYLNKLLDDHIYNKKDNYKKIWCVYSFLIWYEEYFKYI